MTFPIIIGAILVVGGLGLLARWLANADPKLLARHVRISALALGAVIVFALYLSGRLGIFMLIAGMTTLVVLNWRALRARLMSATGPTSGQVSTISTEFLDMRLDHDSGEMDGTVKQGLHEGRDLSALSLEELEVLRGECTGRDPRSVALLEAYLDRRFGLGWRADQDAAEPPADPGGPMTHEEAYRYLGLDPGATAEEIKASHRRMMKNFHPDHGGSDYVAARLNEAKSVLLGD